jgi:hypothetical protein
MEAFNMTKTEWKTRAPFLVAGSWRWITWTHGAANKHAAMIDKAKELGAQSWDYGQADHELADRAWF